ncbi:dual specificity tyrosine-phosphorylation-regulated kinase 2-like [Ciona intestinalis]
MARYPRIWFVGESSNKTIYDKDDDCNFGFDECNENEGKLKVVIGDHIDFRYEVIKKLGSGSFGTVIHACDHAVKLDDPHRMVAIKIMHNDSSAAKYFKQELNMMRLVEDVTEHSTRFSTTIRTFYFRNHFCFVMELLGESLEDAHEDPLHNIPLLRKYTQDMIDGLVILHKHNIIHGDMKPENLMFARNCDASCDVYLKIVDYNLACIQGDPDFECPGVYFQTRYYRAPEVIMDLVYGTVADMWSIGIILAELSLGKVPFYGETTVDQLAAIMEVVGLLPPYMVQASPRIHRYQEAVCYKCKNGFKRTPYRKSFNRVFAGLPPNLYDFIQRCLELDPRKRMTSEEALRHPFLNQSETSEGFWAQDV